MAVKYFIPFYDDGNELWRVDIDIPGFSGTSIELTGVGRSFCQLDYGSSNEDPYEEIISSSLTIQLYNRNDQIDIRELQLLGDQDGRIVLYRNNILEWTGFILPDGIQRIISGGPYVVSITATDGLMLLDNKPFSGVTNWPLPTGMNVRCPLAFVRYVLFGSRNLNTTLPIRWTSEVNSVIYSDDGFAGQTGWGSLGEGWTDLNSRPKSCMYILRGLLSAFQMRIFQSGGKWIIQRVNDVLSGEYSWKEISTEYGPLSIPVLTSGISNSLLAHQFVNENQTMLIKPSLSKMEVKYDHAQAENNLPNGGFEKTGSIGGILNWHFFSNPFNRAEAKVYEDGTINNREGNSLDLSYPLPSTPTNDYAEYSIIGSLPVDSNLLFKRFLLGFIFMPVKGFPYWTTGEKEGFIDFDSKVFQIKVQYINSNSEGLPVEYCLNEFGFWQRLPNNGFLDMVTQYGTKNWKYTFTGTPLAGNVISFRYKYDHLGVTTYPSVDHLVTKDEEANISLLMQGIRNSMISQLPSGSTAWTISTTSNSLTAVNSSPGNMIENGSFIKNGSDSLNEDGYINISVEKMKLGDVASVSVSGRGGNSEILIPDPGDLKEASDPSISTMKIFFKVREGQRYVLDDVYFRFEKNSDVYTSFIDNPKKSNSEKKTLEISSSFTGFMISNIMSSYNQSNTEYKFTDGKYTGSLTGMTANAIMRLRYVPREVFEGDVYVAGNDWNFESMYEIEEKKFIPLNTRYNIETCTVTVVAMECEDGDPILIEDHFGSNDEILSNTD